MRRMEYMDTPPLRYTGSKWKIADWIIGEFPQHDLYCEPYAGGASIFFRKWPSRIEVLNDLSGDVVNFFRVLREQPGQLIEAIELTPYSREEYELCYEQAEDPLERARRFYVVTRQSFGAYSSRRTGWRKQINLHRGKSITSEWRRLDGLSLAVDRLLCAQIENRDAIEVIKDFDSPNALFYVDPPYVLSSRSQGVGRKRYEHEMTDEHHRTLAAALHTVEGMVILSGYESPLYKELYADWRMVSRTTTTNGNGSATECLWISPVAEATYRLPGLDV